MKTILVVYSNTPVSKAEAGRMKKYSFNTSAEVKVGDTIESPEYTTKLQVVKVLDQAFKYFNSSTGELSNEFKASTQWEIRELVIREDRDEVVYGKLVSA